MPGLRDTPPRHTHHVLLLQFLFLFFLLVSRSKRPRIVTIFAFTPADVFKPDKMVMQTYVQEDRPRYGLLYYIYTTYDHHHHPHYNENLEKSRVCHGSVCNESVQGQSEWPLRVLPRESVGGRPRAGGDGQGANSPNPPLAPPSRWSPTPRTAPGWPAG